MSYDRTPMDFKVFNMDRLGPQLPMQEDVNSMHSDDDNYDVELLQRCQYYWDALSDMRDRRRKARMYHRGDQWGEYVYDSVNSEWITEEDYIKNQGKVPLKQNQIRQLVKNIIGQFRADSNKPAVISRIREQAEVGEMLTNTLYYALDINSYKKVDTAAFMEFLLSGIVFQKSRYKYWPKYNRDDVFIENRPVPQMFFNDNIKDVRLTDMDLIGEFYDLPIERLLSVFADSDEREQKIRAAYSQVLNRKDSIAGTNSMLSSDRTDDLDFYNPSEPYLCRVFEVWQKLIEKRLRCHDWSKGKKYVATLDQLPLIEQENTQRIQLAASQGIPPNKVPLIEVKEHIEEFWYVKYLTPYGYVLYESETVYEHKEHPYIVLLYPLIDGEVWGFVEDIIDQQRYINRLIMLMDFMIGAAAKGVLLVPEDSIPDDMDIDDFAEEWSKFNGVIKIKMKPGAEIPKQIASSATVPGLNELLALQLRFMNDISGVSQSIQGQRAPSGTPAKLYAQETMNASLNTKDYFDTFNEAMKERNWKVLKNIIQFYEEDRKVALSGSNYTDEALVYNVEKAQNAEVDVVMTETADSPVYRAIIEDSLQQFVTLGLLPFELYLKNSTLPFSDKLLSDYTKAKQDMIQNGNMANPQFMGALGQQLSAQGANAFKANPNTLQMLRQYAGV